MSLERPTRRTALIALALVAVTPAAALAAQPKSEGAYYTTSTKGGESLAVSVHKHKIINVSGSVRFTKRGKTCTPPTATEAGPFSISVVLKKPVAASSSGSFSFTTKSTAYTHKSFPVKVSGKFTSSKKATIKVSGSYKGCKGSFATSKAAYTQGG